MCFNLTILHNRLVLLSTDCLGDETRGDSIGGAFSWLASIDQIRTGLPTEVLERARDDERGPLSQQ